jgi:hypothetical protein
VAQRNGAASPVSQAAVAMCIIRHLRANTILGIAHERDLARAVLDEEVTISGSFVQVQ